ncbi:unnamed protein product [Prorocentrum cordatum]|uniref:Uncharacterized protein n=1 Tax=Prorocentrum cordatum TaxID=2364126 RepID=A0ABN9TK28_9DINO|nr:unnamed protein product [Polarella glacialis]
MILRARVSQGKKAKQDAEPDDAILTEAICVAKRGAAELASAALVESLEAELVPVLDAIAAKLGSRTATVPQQALGHGSSTPLGEQEGASDESHSQTRSDDEEEDLRLASAAAAPSAECGRSQPRHEVQLPPLTPRDPWLAGRAEAPPPGADAPGPEAAAPAAGGGGGCQSARGRASGRSRPTRGHEQAVALATERCRAFTGPGAAWRSPRGASDVSTFADTYQRSWGVSGRRIRGAQGPVSSAPCSWRGGDRTRNRARWNSIAGFAPILAVRARAPEARATRWPHLVHHRL